MEVITTVNLKMMEEITKDLTKKWSINELSKIMNKHYRPVYTSVQTLLSSGYLIKNENKLIEVSFRDTLLLELGEKIRLTRIDSKEIIIIKDKLNRIKTTFFSAILFGSSVYKKGNDIDLLFIIPFSEDISRFERNIELSLGSSLDLVDLNIISEESCFEMLNRPNELNVMNEIMKNHLVLSGTENFYNILKRWKNA